MWKEGAPQCCCPGGCSSPAPVLAGTARQGWAGAVQVAAAVDEVHSQFPKRLPPERRCGVPADALSRSRALIFKTAPGFACKRFPLYSPSRF